MSGSRPPLHVVAIGSALSIHLKVRTQCFVAQGHRVSLISPYAAEIEGVAVEVVPQKWGRLKLGIYFYIRRLRKLMYQLQPDVLHLHYASPYEITACRLSRIPYVVTMMGSDILKKMQPGKMPAFNQRLVLKGLLQADMLNPVSEHLKARVADLLPGVTQQKLAWGIDLKLFQSKDKSQCREQFFLDEKEYIVLSPRLIGPLYNTRLIVRAFAEFLRQTPNARLVLLTYAARADYLALVRQDIEKLGITQAVSFLDYVENSRMSVLYNSADVMVSLPDSDGMPVSLLEAMACGLPNILGNLELYQEIVTHEESALLVDFDEKALSAALQKLYAQPELHADIKRNALLRVQKQGNLEHDAALIESIYYQLVEKNNHENRLRPRWKL